MDDFYKYFGNHPGLLPKGVVLTTVNIIGGSVLFPSKGKTELFEWEVTFRGDLGNPQWKQNYDLVYDGTRLISVKNSTAKIQQ